METITFIRWRTQELVEPVGSMMMRRGDTHPDLGVELYVGGVAYSLATAVSTVRMTYSITLKQDLPVGSQYVKTSYDSRIVVGSVLQGKDERMTVTKVDASSDPGFLRLKVTRAAQSTSEDVHYLNDQLRVIVFERSASVLDDSDKNKLILEWQAGDTLKSGTFYIEWDVAESGSSSIRFSVPPAPILVNISAVR